MDFPLAKRLNGTGGSVFARIEKRVASLRAQGVDLISLAIGSPDQPTPPHIIESLLVATQKATQLQLPAICGEGRTETGHCPMEQKVFAYSCLLSVSIRSTFPAPPPNGRSLPRSHG